MYTNPWTTVRASDSTLHRDIDAVVNQLALDIAERMDHVIGNSNWSGAVDPVVNESTVKSLVGLKTALDTIVQLTINPTVNRLPRKSGGATFGDSLWFDNTFCMSLVGNKPYAHVKKSGTTLGAAPAYMTFDSEVSDAYNMFELAFPSRLTVPASFDQSGLWLLHCKMTTQVATFANQWFYFRKNGSNIDTPPYISTGEQTVDLWCCPVAGIAGDYFEVYMSAGSNITVFEGSFSAVRLF